VERIEQEGADDAGAARERLLDAVLAEYTQAAEPETYGRSQE
jgi:hypothetical protein